MECKWAAAATTPVDHPTERVAVLDPPPGLRALAERAPISRLRFSDGRAGWLVTSHALARTLMVDNRFRVDPVTLPLGDPEMLAEVDRIEQSTPESQGVLIMLHPPQHTRIRRAAAKYFTVRAVHEQEQAIERIVADRLDAIEAAGGPIDLVTEFALPVSSFSICQQLGVSPADRERFEQPSAILADPHLDAEQKRAALVSFYDYCRQVVAEKRAAPQADILSDLVQQGELSEDEIVGLARQLFEAGHETTASQLSLGVIALLADRSRWEALRADPSLVGNAVEELLRYLSILQLGSFARTADEDVDLGDVVIRKGETVVVSIPVVNRDPEKFPDPEQLDLGRNAAGHLAFGHGRHMCIGQHLARLELKLALRGLLERFPTLDLAVPLEQIRFFGGEHQMYGVESLPVTWRER
ncbi:cytochrome P450 [Patulibacter defluvii]|uniref:cytochrome P450 n=1 Tax=Patulibacter defluvii TaxID=3095358 RepID=UPI002A760639|nr:cytochrome P450 [Patulibacter sp. DM4]